MLDIAAARVVTFWDTCRLPLNCPFTAFALAVTTAEPATVSTYRKLAVVCPAGMDTVVMFAVLALSRNTPVSEVVDSVTDTGPVVFCNWTVSGADATPAVSGCGWGVKAVAGRLGAAGGPG